MQEKIGWSTSVSVIVPLYNSERYIEETLTSVLNQTFKDYEVIVVDDCSTDRSAEIVEGMLERFEGRLRLIRSNQNSGGYPGLVRNIAMRSATGKYISFLDSDDLFTPTALEELFELAEKYQSDVIRSENRYRYKPDTDLAKLPQVLAPRSVNKPTFESDDVVVRLKKFISGSFRGNPPWKYFIRRGFLIENKIEFPYLRIIEDTCFTFQCFVCSPKILLIPNVFYVYRYHSDSISHETAKLDEDFQRYLNDVTETFNTMTDFMDRQEFFVQNPEWKMNMLYHLVRRRFAFSKISQLSEPDLYKHYDRLSEIFLELFSKMNLKHISQMVGCYSCLSIKLMIDTPKLLAELNRYKIQTQLNPIKPPKGALISYFGTFMTVNDAGSKLLHSNVPSNFVTMIQNQENFSLYIPKLKKYIASIDDKLVLTLSDEPVYLGEIVINSVGSISFKINKRYLSARSNGIVRFVDKNRAWEYFRFND